MIARVAFALLMAMLLPFAVLAQEPAATIEAGRAAATIGAADPDHPAWDTAPTSVVKLETAFPGHPSISGTAVAQRVEVKALLSAAGLAIRLEWSDPVADSRKTQDRFADGIAIQFPRDGKTDTTPYMGGAGRTVNIWYWNAARNAAENLWADGFGTLARLPTQDVKAQRPSCRRQVAGGVLPRLSFVRAASSQTTPHAGRQAAPGLRRLGRRQRRARRLQGRDPQLAIAAMGQMNPF